VLVAHHDTVIEAEDHVIVFVVDKENTKAVEKLFAVNFSFF
jgi:trk system potassium uptake protein